MPWVFFYVQKKNAYLQATSIASFKWHLAVNETHILPLSSSGICTSISEAGVRSWAERETGEERKALRGRASQPETGERNLPAAGGHSALSVRSQTSGPLYNFLRNYTGVFTSHRYNCHRCLSSQPFKTLELQRCLYKIILFYLQSTLNQRPRVEMFFCLIHIFYAIKIDDELCI